MEKTIRLLKVCFWVPIFVSLLMVIICECDIMLPEPLFDDRGEYTVLMLMELLTLAVIPGALFLFKHRNIRRQLVEKKETALARYGVIRLLMIGLTLVANTYFYYLSGFNVAFGYLAIILVLVMPFIYPSNERCVQETSSKEL